ncbi:serine aminopeptidase S33 family [Hypnocyclicus thermotrophus]|uniref:Serine aminopeptidase S33 family n=1 Tax=Hypnocyclicus thermotrophus TaxID=1627895 RepID=A0AA46DZ73_9FUSO|nr:alpha/beta fold hydrolase [Hypnocyclicus thermotrophus]TDT71436.1 serine aminopeptidase S33 family [Hypnocyclicus thermotrophus]
MNIKKNFIEDISCSIFYKNTTKKIPLVVVLHGYNGSKNNLEKRLNIGKKFANNGYYTVLYDAPNHGERNKYNIDNNHDMFFYLLKKNVVDLEKVINYFKKLENIDENKIFLTGISFGAMTIFKYISKYTVFASAPIVGCSNIDEFILHYNKNNIIKKIDKITTEIIENFNPFDNIIKNYNNHLIMINGKYDKIMPYHSNEKLYKTLKKKYNHNNNNSLLEFYLLDYGHFQNEEMFDIVIKKFNQILKIKNQ